MIRTTNSGIEIDVRVIPRANRTALAGVRSGALLVRLAAAPVEGAANEALVAFLAKQVGIAKRAVRIVAGERGRLKNIAIDGVTEPYVAQKLGL